jgi:4'-phosphopantetheinyl transferase
LPAVGEVHLWRVALPARPDAGRIQRLEAMLPPEDLARCQRFREPGVRARSLAARAALRGVLGACLGEDPRRVPLLAGPGKPRLAGDSGLEFSLSHSGGLALLAVGRSIRLGADVERVRDLLYQENVLERFFGEEERRQVLALEGEEQRRAFFRLWTRREAAAKALGLGILEHFRRFPQWAPEPSQGDWELLDLRPARGYVGAVCREGRGAIAAFWTWRGLPS